MNSLENFKKQVTTQYNYTTTLLISTKEITLEMIDFLEENNIKYAYDKLYVEIFVK